MMRHGCRRFARELEEAGAHALVERDVGALEVVRCAVRERRARPAADGRSRRSVRSVQRPPVRDGVRALDESRPRPRPKPWYATDDAAKRSQSTIAPRSSAGRMTVATSWRAGGFEEEQLGQRVVERRAAQHQLADALAERRAAGLARQQHVDAVGAQAVAERAAGRSTCRRPRRLRGR